MSVKSGLTEVRMTTKSEREIFVNLAVRDLQRSMAFFSKLGFEFNPKFTDDKAACMVVSDEAFVMLLEEGRFRDFTKHQICDTRTSVVTCAAYAWTACAR